MKLKIKRSQKSGMMSSKITFQLHAQTDLTPEENGYVKKYKMGREVLYSKEKVDASEVGYSALDAAKSIGRTFAAMALNITITADDLVNGKTIECKDIIEMRAAEEQLKEACLIFKEILESAAHFEGEEVIEY